MIKLRPLKHANIITYYTLSLLSGIFMGATVAPIGAWFLAWVSLAPLLMLVVKFTPKTDKNYQSPPSSWPHLGHRLSRSCHIMDYRYSSHGLAGCPVATELNYYPV